MKKVLGAMALAMTVATFGLGGVAAAQVQVLKRPAFRTPTTQRLPQSSKKPEAAKPAPATKRVFSVLCVGPEKIPGMGTAGPIVTLSRKLARGGLAGALGGFVAFTPDNLRGVSAPAFTTDSNGQPMACVTLEVEVAK